MNPKKITATTIKKLIIQIEILSPAGESLRSFLPKKTRKPTTRSNPTSEMALSKSALDTNSLPYTAGNLSSSL